MNAEACPRCQVPLQAATEGGITIDRCPDCGGAWYDRTELERRVTSGGEAEAVPAFQEERVQYLRCPRCLTLMTRRAYQPGAGVILDYCGQHGVWVDRGELERVQAYVESGGPERRAEKDAEDARLRASIERFGRDTSAGAFSSLRWLTAPVIPR